jgi:K+-transporting ATPase ATPase B chain
MTPSRTETAALTYAEGNPLGTPGEHKHHTKAPAKLTLSNVAAALPLAVRKLAPRQMIHSPVMFTVLAGAVLCTGICVFRPSVFGVAVTAWLWLTVLFGNLSEAIAEGRGKAQADSLRASRKDVMARLRLPGGATREVPGTELRRGDLGRRNHRRPRQRGRIDHHRRIGPRHPGIGW